MYTDIFRGFLEGLVRSGSMQYIWGPCRALGSLVKSFYIEPKYYRNRALL